MNELKPCPFCGCPKIGAGYIRDGADMHCTRCGARTHAFEPKATEKAEEKWNSRFVYARASSPDPAREALVVALKGYCAEHERHHCFLPYPHEKCPCELCKIATAALAEQGHK